MGGFASRWYLFWIPVILLPGVVYATPDCDFLERDKTYTIELPNGSVLREAVFRTRQGKLCTFDIPGVGRDIALADFRIIPEPAPRQWLLTAALTAGWPLNQKQLGFQQSFSGEFQYVMQMLPQVRWWLPWFSLKGGFLRLDGSRALLSGPELTLGPVWLIAVSRQPEHFLYMDTTAGAGFYRLLNEKIERTYRQDTFLLQSQLGYLFQKRQWGVLVSWAQSFIYDTNYPLLTGGIRFAVVYRSPH